MESAFLERVLCEQGACEPPEILPHSKLARTYPRKGEFGLEGKRTFVLEQGLGPECNAWWAVREGVAPARTCSRAPPTEWLRWSRSLPYPAPDSAAPRNQACDSRSICQERNILGLSGIGGCSNAPVPLWPTFDLSTGRGGFSLRTSGHSGSNVRSGGIDIVAGFDTSISLDDRRGNVSVLVNFS